MRMPALSPTDNNGFPRVPFGLPNLRRNVCPHFYMTGPRGPIPITRAAPAQGAHAPGDRTSPAASCAAASTWSRATCPISASRRVSTSASSTRTSSTLSVELARVAGRGSSIRRIRRPSARPAAGARTLRHPTGPWLARAPCCGGWAIPRLACAGVLIGGTNGKGSTQAMVGAVLREAGLRVGQTPKPHLVSYRERIVRRWCARSRSSDFVAVVNGGAGRSRARRPATRATHRVRDAHRAPRSFAFARAGVSRSA